MEKRISIIAAAALLGVQTHDLLDEAINGNLRAEIRTTLGYEGVTKKSLRELLGQGFFNFGKNKFSPARKGESHFERLSKAHTRVESVIQQVPLSALFLYESEVMGLRASEKLSPQVEPSKATQKRSPRLAQQGVTQDRRNAILNYAKKLTDSSMTQNFCTNDGKPIKRRIADHIVRNYKAIPELAAHTITLRIVAKELALLK